MQCTDMHSCRHSAGVNCSCCCLQGQLTLCEQQLASVREARRCADIAKRELAQQLTETSEHLAVEQAGRQAAEGERERLRLQLLKLEEQLLDSRSTLVLTEQNLKQQLADADGYAL